MLRKLFLSLLACNFYCITIISMSKEDKKKLPYVFHCPLNCKSNESFVCGSGGMSWANSVVEHFHKKHNNQQYKKGINFFQDLVEKNDGHLYWKNQKVTNKIKKIIAKCDICPYQTRKLYRSAQEALHALEHHYSEWHEEVKISIPIFKKDPSKYLYEKHDEVQGGCELKDEPDLTKKEFIVDESFWKYGEDFLQELPIEYDNNLENKDFENGYNFKCPEVNCAEPNIIRTRITTMISGILYHMKQHHKDNLIIKFKKYNDILRTEQDLESGFYLMGQLISDLPKIIYPKCPVSGCSYRAVKPVRYKQEEAFLLQEHFRSRHSDLFRKFNSQKRKYENIDDN